MIVRVTKVHLDLSHGVYDSLCERAGGQLKCHINSSEPALRFVRVNCRLKEILLLFFFFNIVQYSFLVKFDVRKLNATKEIAVLCLACLYLFTEL